MLHLSPDAVQLPPDPQDSLNLSNDTLGVRIFGPPSQPTLLLGKSDIWDRRWFGNRKPAVTMKQIREFVASDRAKDPDAIKEFNYPDYGRYDFPCPKPGAQLILQTPFATETNAEPGPGNSVRLSLRGNGKRLDMEIWVAVIHPLVVIQCESKGLDPGDLSVRVYRHRDTIVPGGLMHPTTSLGPSATNFEPFPFPRCCAVGDSWGIVQEFPADDTFDPNFRIAALCTMPGHSPEVECREEETGLGTRFCAEKEGRVSHMVTKRYTPINEVQGSASTAAIKDIPSSFNLLATLMTSQDGDDPVEEAFKTLNEAGRIGLDQLRSEQEKALHNSRRVNRACISADPKVPLVSPADWGSLSYSLRSRKLDDGKITLEATETVMPSLRRKDGHYGDIWLCSVDTTKLCFQDSSSWKADFHFNEVRSETMFTLGLFEEILPYCHMIHGLLPQAAANARDVYELPGAMYPVVHFPLKSSTVTHINVTWEQDMGLNGLITKPLWLYYRYTQDLDFLRKVAYPVLRECARFSYAYLTPDEAGMLHIMPCVSPEHWGLTPNFERNKDCTSAITLTKYLLKAAATAAGLLGVDSEEAEAWNDASGRLVPYPTYRTDEGPVWVDVAGAPPIEYNIPVPLSPIFWGDDVGLDSQDDMLVLAKRTLARIQVWQPHSFYLNNFIRPRLGMWNPDMQLGPENLLLSYQSIRLFPAVPPDAEIAIENLAAQGGFRVSAVRTREGHIKDVRIESTAGCACRLANPWTSTPVVTTSRGENVAVSASPEGCVEFVTTAGETYQIKENR